MKQLDIRTGDGVMPCRIFTMDDSEPHPLIILFMDGFGLRPALNAMAERLARNGYFVALPDLFYRSGAYAAFDPASAFKPGPKREQLMKILALVQNEKVAADMANLIGVLDNEGGILKGKTGCVGYCLGGGLAVYIAAAFPERIVAAASIHAGRLITDKPDSPHRQLEKVRGHVYVAAPEIDSSFQAEQREIFSRALSEFGIRGGVEFYPGASHGFAMADTPLYNHTAAEHHWDKILQLFKETLS